MGSEAKCLRTATQVHIVMTILGWIPYKIDLRREVKD